MRASLASKSAAALKAQSHVAPLKTKLKNGLSVVAQDNNGAVSQLILAFRAGSRYQSVTQQGLVHHIRNFVGRDVQSYPGLQLVWSSAASGGQLNSFASRDVFGVQMSVPRDKADYALSILGQVAAQPAFKPWEMEDVLPTIHADLAQKTARAVVFEDIHRAAFRNDSLGFSLYSSKNQIGAYKSEELQEFARKHFVSGNGVLVGINVDSGTLQQYGEENGAIRDGIAVMNHGAYFRGGDHRRFARGNDVHIMIAGAGAPVGDVKSLAAQHVLLAHIGQSSPLKLRILGSSSSEVDAFGASYDGSGLIGAYLHTSGAKAESAVKKTVEALRNAKIQKLEECKRRAINEIHFTSESSLLSGYEHATNALYKGPELSELVAEIQKVDQSAIDRFAKNAFERLAIAAYGNHSTVPYSDEI